MRQKEVDKNHPRLKPGPAFRRNVDLAAQMTTDEHSSAFGRNQTLRMSRRSSPTEHGGRDTCESQRG